MLKSRWFWGVFAGFVILISIFWSKRENKTILWSDVEGYYLYLPATFIYGFDALPVNTPNEFTKAPDGIYYTRFSYGVALFELPFFLLTHVTCKILGWKADGYGLPYQVSVYLAMAFYLSMGCWLLFRVLRRFTSNHIAAMVTAGLVLGTNLFHYSIWGGAGHSHTIQFMLMAALLYISPNVWTDVKARWLWFGIAAVMTLIRIPHFFWVLLPLFYGLRSKEELWQRIRISLLKLYWLQFIVVLGIIMFPQLLYYKVSVGSWLVNAYDPGGTGNTFPYLWEPRLWRILWDVRNGLFVYAPVLLFALPGVWLIWKRGYQLAILGTSLLFVILWWTLGAWNMYWLGGLGHRGFIDVFPVLAIAMVFFLNSWEQYKAAAAKWMLTTVFAFTVYLGLGFNIKYDFPWQPPQFGWEDYRVVVNEALSFNWKPYQPYNRPARVLQQELPTD